MPILFWVKNLTVWRACCKKLNSAGGKSENNDHPELSININRRKAIIVPAAGSGGSNILNLLIKVLTNKQGACFVFLINGMSGAIVGVITIAVRLRNVLAYFSFTRASF
jgi:hypothetical protein